MNTIQLLILKEQLRAQVNQIIQEEGASWFVIADEEEYQRKRLIDAVYRNDENEILMLAKDYADILITRKVIRSELQAKYAVQLEQIQNINQQLKQKMN